ncbi:DUF2391 family protein [Candidatus Woesearchaeota archaeon]|nr:DUF2391 family protein [Candidatus Woesearchaeota archaeon]
MAKLDDLNDKLDRILRNQRLLLHEEHEVILEEEKIEKLEHRIEKEEEQEQEALRKEEEELKQKLKKKILKNITIKDINKGLIGAFIGTIGHFAFFEGKHVAHDMTTGWATMLFVFSYLIGVLFIYFSGFKTVKRKMILHLIPLRVSVMFVISILSTIIILILFQQITLATSFSEAYRTVASVSVLAMFGATTADFLE